MEASGYFTIQKYVNVGLGVGFCLVPTEIVEMGEPGLSLILLRDLFGFEDIEISLMKDKDISTPLKTFLNSLLGENFLKEI